VCALECEQGYCAMGSHTCGADGVFRGGNCTALPCLDGTTLEHSATMCSGVTGEQCNYTCAAGYAVDGDHMCLPNQSFVGGSCAPLPCDDVTLANSQSECVGTTTDVCAYECDFGYTAVGAHVCGTNGQFAGGHCTPDPCTAGLTVLNSDTRCEGRTGDTCEIECDGGYFQTTDYGATGHVCQADGNFTGVRCEPMTCTSGNRIAHSSTQCTGTTGDICDYSCWLGYAVSGTHRCRADRAFSGGDCELVRIALGRLIRLHLRLPSEYSATGLTMCGRALLPASCRCSLASRVNTIVISRPGPPV
jgi:hypothetical protein